MCVCVCVVVGGNKVSALGMVRPILEKEGRKEEEVSVVLRRAKNYISFPWSGLPSQCCL